MRVGFLKTLITVFIKVRLDMLRILLIGDMYFVKSRGPRTDPSGTPQLMETIKELWVANLTYNFFPVKYGPNFMRPT